MTEPVAVEGRDAAAEVGARWVSLPDVALDEMDYAEVGAFLVDALLGSADVVALIRDDQGAVRVVGLERVGRVDKPSPTDTFWSVEGDEINHPTVYLDLATEQDDISLPDDPGWYDPVYRLTAPEDTP
jgi:hypothetical protein